MAAGPDFEECHALQTAELLAAGWLGVESPERVPGPRAGWTPEGEIIDVFLERYLLSAYGRQSAEVISEAERALFGDEEAARVSLNLEAELLAELLGRESFAGELVVPLPGLRFASPQLEIDERTTIAKCDSHTLDDLWSRRGSGVGPTVQIADLNRVTHAIRVSMSGPRSSTWNWAAAQNLAGKVRTALLIAGVQAVPQPITWMRLDPRFGDYLARLGCGGGFTLPAQSQRYVDELISHEAEQKIPEIFHALPDAADGVLALALRRLDLASDRQLPEDRLVDTWIAIEALFTPDQGSELNYRATMRTARFTEDEASARVAMFQQLRNS